MTDDHEGAVYTFNPHSYREEGTTAPVSTVSPGDEMCDPDEVEGVPAGRPAELCLCVLVFFLILLLLLTSCWLSPWLRPLSSDEKWRQVEISFNLDVATVGLLASKSAYCSPELVSNWTCEVCVEYLPDFRLHRVYTNETKSTLGISGVLPSQGLIVLAFRGTSNTENWLDDLKFLFQPYLYPDCEGCAVHIGFFTAFESIQAQLREDVTYLRRQYPYYKVLVTGHSLGGAIATLSALDLVTMPNDTAPFLWQAGNPLPNHFAAHEGEEYTIEDRPVLSGRDEKLAQGRYAGRPGLNRKRKAPSKRSSASAPLSPVHKDRLLLYTFGSPRVGNINFSIWADQQLSFAYRITHQRDVVPHVPPATLGYVHTPHEYWFNNSESSLSYVTCNDTSLTEDPDCSNSVWVTDFADHRLYLGIATGCRANLSAGSGNCR